MSSFDGSLAMMLDFGGIPDGSASATAGRAALPSFGPDTPAARSHVRSWAVRNPALRAAPDAAFPAVVPHGPEKYRALERRRRHAQIKARHLLDRLDQP